MRSFAFDRNFSIEVNGNEYFVEVVGVMEDYYGANSPVIDKVFIEDSNGNMVESGHEDYDDILNELDEAISDIEYEEEMFPGEYK